MREDLSVQKEKNKIMYIAKCVPASAIIKVDMIGGTLLKPEASFIAYFQQYNFGLQ